MSSYDSLLCFNLVWLPSVLCSSCLFFFMFCGYICTERWIVSSVMSDSSRPHGLQQARLPCPLPTPRACANSCPSSQWCHPTISSSVVPISCLQSFQHQSLFQWVSSLHQMTKVLELQLQHQSFQWIFQTDFLEDWLVWSHCSTRDAQVFSNTSVQKHQFFSAWLSV